MTTRSQLRARVYRRAGLPIADGLVTAEVVNEAINEALHYIETVNDWWWLDATETIATVAGTQTVAVNDSCRKTRSLAYTDGAGQLEEIGIADVDRIITTGTGRPHEYATYGQTITLNPTPDAAYDLRHRYVTVEPDLTDDNGIPLMPAEYHGALVDYATFLSLRDGRDPERAETARASYREWEAQIIDNVRRSTKPKHPRIRTGSAF